MPVLLIVGEYDEACVPVHAFMGRTIPNAAHHVLPGAGHLTNLEGPEAFNRLVAEFLDAHVAKLSPPPEPHDNDRHIGGGSDRPRSERRPH